MMLSMRFWRTVRQYALLFIVGALGALFLSGPPASARVPKGLPPICGGPLPSGPITSGPRIDMTALPHDDLGWPELILRVRSRGERFCYRYAYGGRTYHRAPIMVVRPGDRFAVRVVNEMTGPASGARMAASALPPCKPRPMPNVMPRPFVGYFDHTIEARAMKLSDTDVNMHFHGFVGPASEENIFLSTLSTPARACEYDITVPRTQPPGTYFYHPHAHGAAEDEVAGGLSGMWIVEPATTELPVRDEHAIVLRYRIPFLANWNYVPSELPLVRAAAAHEATLAPHTPVAFDPFDPPPWPSAVPMRGHGIYVARCGSRPDARLAVDGVDAPGELSVPAGEPQLLRVLNATSDSIVYMRVRAHGRDRSFKIVGRDGTPVGGDDAAPLARFIAARQATLVPAARVDILLTLKAGQKVTLYTHRHCNAPSDAVARTQPLLVVRASAPLAHPTVVATRPLTAAQSPAAKLVAYVRAHPQLVRKRAFTYTEYVLPKAHGRGAHGAYYLTETSRPGFHETPFWPTYAKGAMTPDPTVVVRRGTIEEWYLFNTTLETHSFHIHQMNFVAVNVPGGPMTLDTVEVPFGRMLPNPKSRDYPLIAPSVTRVILDFRHMKRGTFVFHCHMLFHEDRGMMGVIKVV